MKRKYLLRGIGIGLCIGVAVSYTAFKTGNYVSGSESSTSTEQMTEDPTKASEEQAKKEVEAQKASEEQAKQEAEAQKASEEKAKQEAEEQKASEEKAKQEAEQKASEEKAKQEAEQKASEEKAKQEEEQKNQGQTVEIEVKRGMSSEKIARLLQENGLVDNSADFDKWLKNNKYSNKLHYGTMTIKKGLTYEELAKELTTQGR
ncbi:MAG: hypothetical protein K5897_10180 [Eubacterium sp.]|nr:hypothetical protein [Eubacterium sp.]